MHSLINYNTKHMFLGSERFDISNSLLKLVIPPSLFLYFISLLLSLYILAAAF